MKKKSDDRVRVLAIYPNTGGFGFAVLEGPDRLIEWATVHIKGRDHDACIARAAKLIDRYRPDALVTEHPNKSPHRGQPARQLAADLLVLATKKRIRRGGIARESVRRYFLKLNAETKHRMAEAIADRFLELQSRLPRVRRPWMSENPAMTIFDSIALALTWMDSS
jgi:hypothetical protein